MEFIGPLLPFVLIIGLMYVMMIRPQQKKQKETQAMLDSLQKGDSIVTIGGLHGVVDEVIADNNSVVIDCEGIYLTFERWAIKQIVLKADNAPAATTEELGTNTPEETNEEE